jgi:hypothetical protein
MRYKDKYQHTATTIDRIYDTRKYTWTGQPATSGLQQLNAADAVVAMHSDSPLHGYSLYDPNTQSSTVTTTWVGPGNTPNVSLDATTGVQQTTGPGGYLKTAYARWVSSTGGANYQPNGPQLFAKIDETDNTRWIFVNLPVSLAGVTTAGYTTMTVTFAAPVTTAMMTTAGFGSLFVKRYNKGLKSNVPVALSTSQPPASPPAYSAFGPSIQLVNAQQTYTIALQLAGQTLQSDYMAVSVPQIPDSLLPVTIQVAETCGMFTHIPVKQYWNNALDVPQARVNAASVLWSDVAAPLNIEGTVAIAALARGQTWQDFLQQGSVAGGPFNAIAGGNFDQGTMGTWDMIKGAYSFSKPVTEKRWELKKIVDSDYTLQLIYDIAYNPISPDCQVIIMSMSTIPNGTQGGLGADTLLHFNWVIEGRGANFWRTAQFPPSTFVSAWNKALVELENVPQLAENPSHLVEIWNAIKHAATKFAPIAYRALKQYGPAASVLLSKFFPEGAPIFSAANRVISALPDSAY